MSLGVRAPSMGQFQANLLDAGMSEAVLDMNVGGLSRIEVPR
jgi:hypothetical protein